MIRLPLTTISLKPRDIKDFERRQRRRRNLDVENAPHDFCSFTNLAVGSLGHPREQKPDQELQRPASSKNFGEPYLRALSLVVHPDSCSPDLKGDIVLATLELEEPGEICDAPEEFSGLPDREVQRSPTPPIGEFHYGGFIEVPPRPTEIHHEDATPPRKAPMVLEHNLLEASSPFMPDDMSTPQPIGDPRRLRHRFPPPRSPLYLSQNISSSPERTFTTGLTPRVVSRVATHHTPGIIFAAPARRPRKLRHQPNSFSFDSSERASAAYEQDRRSSDSMDLSLYQQVDNISLHEELRGSSLQSSRVNSGASFSHPNFNVRKISGAAFSLPDIERPSSYTNGGNNEEFVEISSGFSSPQLHLPPPFSAVSRRVSKVGSLPSPIVVEHAAAFPAASPPGSHSSTPARSIADGRESSQTSSSPARQQSIERVSRRSPSSRISPRAYVQRILSNVRRQSPLGRRHTPERPASAPTVTADNVRRGPSASPLSSSSLSESPEQSQRHQEADHSPQTPPRPYRVYNDAASSRIQPQTPANLPEARHQSRYHSSYTAPMPRIGWQRATREHLDNTDGVGMERQNMFSRSSGVLSLVSTRSHSPVGLRIEGFQGLYGGRENGDDEQNWADGVRFDNAGTRLFDRRRVTSEEISLRETPEPEDWRLERGPLF